MVFLFLVIITQMLQPAVLTSGLFRQFTVLGLGDTWMAMIFINAAFNLSFAVWIMHSFFAGIPKEVDEAAQIDGAGRFTVLFKINLPLVWPGIVTAIVFHVRRLLERVRGLPRDPVGPTRTSHCRSRSPSSSGSTRPVGSTCSVSRSSRSLPVVILFMLIEKRLVGGLTAGSVK